MKHVSVGLVFVLGVLLILSMQGCSWAIQASSDDPSSVLEWENVCREDVEKRLGAPVRVDRGASGDMVCDYKYTYAPGRLGGNGLEGWWARSGGEGILVRALAEPVMIGVSIADKQKHRLPGEATVAYDRDGRVKWWLGSRSQFKSRVPGREQEP